MAKKYMSMSKAKNRVMTRYQAVKGLAGKKIQTINYKTSKGARRVLTIVTTKKVRKL